MRVELYVWNLRSWRSDFSIKCAFNLLLLWAKQKFLATQTINKVARRFVLFSPSRLLSPAAFLIYLFVAESAHVETMRAGEREKMKRRGRVFCFIECEKRARQR